MSIHWLAALLVGAAGFFVAWLIAARFGRGATDSSLEMRRSRLLSALDSSGIGAWIWEVRTRQFFCDTRACQNLSARPGSVLWLDDFLARIAPSDRARVELAMQHASVSDQPFELVARVAGTGDVERYVALKGRPELDSRGAPVRITGALRDVTEQRRRNAELRRHSQILAQVHDAIFAAGADGRILSWNPAAERVYGYPADEAIGRAMHMLWFEEDRDGLAQNLSAAAVASGAHEFIARVRHRSGEEIYAHFRLAPLRDADGETIGLLACSTDVTSQRQEHELLALQASALESIDDAVLVTDRLDRIIHANDAAEALFTRPGRKLLGAPVSDLLVGGPRRGPDPTAAVRSALAREGKWMGELACARPGGAEPILARAGVRLLDLDSGPACVWVLHDVTEERRAEAALIERERRFRNLADSAPMMVWITGPKGSLEYLNEQGLRIAGATRGSAAGDGWKQVVHPDDLAKLMPLLDCENGPKAPFEIEIRIVRKGGGVVQLLTKGVPRLEDGRVAGYLGSGVDITEIKEAEEERIRLEQKALKEQKLYSLGVLAGGIAHDFNNLLVSILGFSDLALRDLEARHPARELVEQIELGARRAAGLVKQILTFAGKAPRVSEEVDLNHAVLETANLFQRSLTPGVVIDLQLDNDLSPLYADPAQVRQVVMNLLFNASDALASKGGRIRIRTDLERILPDDSRQWAGDPPPPGPYVVLEVSDDGCGMTPETLAQMFDPFYTTKATGRGLGLSAVMGVVRSHSGSVRVESARGRGSRFVVLFPLDTPVPPGPAAPRLAGSGAPCALVVDDDLAVIEATCQMLRSGGLKVYAAQSEKDAVSVLRQRRGEIRLVILDVVMPTTTPARVAARLREVDPDVQILLASGYSDAQLRPPIDGRTFVGFLPKPYSRDELLEAVAQACPSIVLDLAEGSASA